MKRIQIYREGMESVAGKNKDSTKERCLINTKLQIQTGFYYNNNKKKKEKNDDKIIVHQYICSTITGISISEDQVDGQTTLSSLRREESYSLE